MSFVPRRGAKALRSVAAGSQTVIQATRSAGALGRSKGTQGYINPILEARVDNRCVVFAMPSTMPQEYQAIRQPCGLTNPIIIPERNSYVPGPRRRP